MLIPQRFLINVMNMTIDENVIVSDIANYFNVTDEFAYYRLSLIHSRISVSV